MLQTQQGVLEKALLREREAVQRAYMLELKLRQAGCAAGRLTAAFAPKKLFATRRDSHCDVALRPGPSSAGAAP